jgi:hypothetical protein
MSLIWIALFAVAYVVVTAIVLVLLTAAKRADAEAQRQHEDLVRSLESKPPPVLVADDEPRREMVARRLAG